MLTKSKINILKTVDRSMISPTDKVSEAVIFQIMNDDGKTRISRSTLRTYLGQLCRDNYLSVFNYRLYSRTDRKYPGSNEIVVKTNWLTPLHALIAATSHGITLETHQVKTEVSERAFITEEKIVLKIKTKALNPEEVQVVCDCLNNHLSNLLPPARQTKQKLKVVSNDA